MFSPASPRTAAAIERMNAGERPVPMEETLPRRTAPKPSRKEFTDEEYGKASRLSESTPPDVPRFEEGTLRVDRYGEVSELRELEIESLIEAEEEKRGPIVDKYVEWVSAGHEPPPISAVETETGRTTVVDGHHRLAVARARGARTIMAWVAMTTNKLLRGEPDRVVMPYPVHWTLR